MVFGAILSLHTAASADDAPHARMRSPQPQTVEINCVYGFGGWGKIREADQERACDAKNLKKFLEVFGKCGKDKKQVRKPTDPASPASFDMDRDGCATCADFKEWKKFNLALFGRKNRNTDGADLTLSECPEDQQSPVAETQSVN